MESSINLTTLQGMFGYVQANLAQSVGSRGSDNAYCEATQRLVDVTILVVKNSLSNEDSRLSSLAQKAFVEINTFAQDLDVDIQTGDLEEMQCCLKHELKQRESSGNIEDLYRRMKFITQEFFNQADPIIHNLE